ncbi:MAG: hypothetical protein AABZ55_11455 [Bdellovibrionota bacterium]
MKLFVIYFILIASLTLIENNVTNAHAIGVANPLDQALNLCGKAVNAVFPFIDKNFEVTAKSDHMAISSAQGTSAAVASYVCVGLSTPVSVGMSTYEVGASVFRKNTIETNASGAAHSLIQGDEAPMNSNRGEAAAMDGNYKESEK